MGVHLHAAGKQIISDGIALTYAALAAALFAVKTEAMAAQERVCAATLTWERERTAVDAVARRVVETEHYLLLAAGQQPIVHYTDTVAFSSHQSLPAGSGSRLGATDPIVTQLHLQAIGVQNI